MHIVICWEWFPSHKGFVTGLISGAVGIGSLIFSIMSTAIVNPENSAPYLPFPGAKEQIFPRHIADKIPKMFRYCLLVWTLLSFVGIVLCRRNPKYLNPIQVRKDAN